MSFLEKMEKDVRTGVKTQIKNNMYPSKKDKSFGCYQAVGFTSEFFFSYTDALTKANGPTRLADIRASGNQARYFYIPTPGLDDH